MSFIRKHWALLIWLIAAIICLILHVHFWQFLLGTLVYLLILLIARWPRTLAWIGYFTQATFHKSDKALKRLDKAYKMGARVPAPTIAYGMLLLKNWRYDEALKAFQEVIVTPGLNSVLLKIARQDMGIAYEKTGDLTSAVTTLEQMEKDYDILDPDFYTALAYYYIEQGDLEKARETNDKALLKDEGNAGAYDNLGLIAYQSGNLEDASAYFHKALELKDTLVSSLYYLGLIAEKNGDEEEARTYFTAAHNAPLTGLNTIRREMVQEKYEQYMVA